MLCDLTSFFFSCIPATSWLVTMIIKWTRSINQWECSADKCASVNKCVFWVSWASLDMFRLVEARWDASARSNLHYTNFISPLHLNESTWKIGLLSQSGHRFWRNLSVNRAAGTGFDKISTILKSTTTSRSCVQIISCKNLWPQVKKKAFPKPKVAFIFNEFWIA